jgi:formiminotetrahydrofolate cyclodeaminase
MTLSTGIEAATVQELAGAVASDEPTPGGGAVAAVVAALAAALAAMAGRYSVQHATDPEPFRQIVERADAIRLRATVLADDDAIAYRRYVEASQLPRDPNPLLRARAVRAALGAAASVPLELARLAAEIATAGEELAASGNPNLRSDACAATLLAAAVGTSAAILVGENLKAELADPRVTDARRYSDKAAHAAERVLEQFDYLPHQVTK